MDGDLLAELVRGVYGCFDFLVAVGFKTGDVIVGPGGGVHLDDVGSCGNLLAHDAKNFGNAIGDSTGGRIYPWFVLRIGDVEPIAADKHWRPDHFSAIDEVAHGDVQVLIRAEVAYRGH